MSARSERWRSSSGAYALWRFVYHPGDLDTASYPSRYVQRNPRLVPLRSAPGYPIQALASDGELHYAECAAGRACAHGVFKVVERG